MDELFITIRGERHYLWRAVDPDGDVLDIVVTPPGQESRQTLVIVSKQFTIDC